MIPGIGAHICTVSSSWGEYSAIAAETQSNRFICMHIPFKLFPIILQSILTRSLHIFFDSLQIHFDKKNLKIELQC